MKTCTRCHQTKPLTEFPYHPKTSDHHYRICMDCKGKGTNPWNRTNYRDRGAYVYLIQAENGLCKIGITDNPDRRIRAMQLQSPVLLILFFSAKVRQAAETETQLHTLFKAQHSHGEWFRLSPEQLEQAKELICHAK